MKLRNILWVAVAVVAFSSCKDDGTGTPIDTTDNGNGGENKPAPIEVVEKNMSLVNKMTATWCGPCGGWGWTLFEEIISATHNDAVIMGTYGSSSSKYYHSTADAFKKEQAASAGWPAFCANGTNRTEYSQSGGIYTATTRANVIAEVNRHKEAQVLIGAGYRDTIIDGKIKIDVKTKFFQNGDEAFEYYVGAYVSEDKVIGYQAGNSAGNNASHHHVLRASMTDDAWGVKITNGITSGSEFEHSFELPVDPEWNTDNLEYSVVIWKKIGPRYLFVNAYEDKN